LILHYLNAFRIDRPFKISPDQTWFSPNSKHQETKQSILLIIGLHSFIDAFKGFMKLFGIASAIKNSKNDGVVIDNPVVNSL